ncbi:hypothetical protein TRIUR3_02018 [Triticum urartu]|uniref:Uncharacterized protein n=1 Tax=Triticum urartu TaxID=4572 RepID=M7ZTT5_TRIUA|nr:hypothetical protein TRIUR3_02018 [Triticum urartu]
MNKVLAFSILSASPADIAPEGSWAWLSWRGRKLQEDKKAGAGQQGKQGGLRPDAEQQAGKGKTILIHDFDWINKFSN